MIKNIVFDVGMVLVDFNWQGVMEELGFRGEVFERVADATVRSDVWSEHDRGKLTDEKVLEGFLANAPEYETEIHMFWENIPKTIRQYDYALDWVRGWKRKGYHVYILSNYPKRTYELTQDALSFEKEMDGSIFSYQIQCIKPEPEIYQALFEKYYLKPQECVFLDDNENNIKAAKRLGMQGILFKEKAQAERELEALGVS